MRLTVMNSGIDRANPECEALRNGVETPMAEGVAAQ